MTDWEAYRQYQCHLCKDNCINRIGDQVTEARECRTCYQVTGPDDPPTTSKDPQRAAPSHGGPSEDPQRTARRRRANLDAVRSRGGLDDDWLTVDSDSL
ncbi:hypothetical protein C475_15208 [Halosimplex carlsbadense 2-9-1]|uniref:Uncharacterized protein n=1 Tax=Halosimplex carlsbadense 2-9-1 TaxID=797114 RepID=M0CK67_9EURY|nr:hypothetical protein C475_15208 [Halosimplex carlsbadense 2-9-1]